MGRNVLVTGGGGFVGAWVLRELLARGLSPILLDLQDNTHRWSRVLGSTTENFTYVRGDLADRQGLRRVFDEHEITHVIHLGALLTPACQQDPWLGCQVNVLGSVTVFDQVRAAGSRIQGMSYASSLGVYGPQPDDRSFAAQADEIHSPTFYGVYKRAVEQIAQQYWQHFNIRSVGICPYVAYGPERDQGLTAAPSLAARAAARGERFTISYTGAARYDYVEDVARAFVQTALSTPAGAHVVEFPSEIATPKDIVLAIDSVVPGAAKNLVVEGPPLPFNVPPRRALISTIVDEWKTTSLTEGMRRTIDFYRSRSD